MYSTFLTTFCGILCLSTTVAAQYYALTGVQTGRGQNGTRPLRRNIYDFQNDQPAFSLYIQALGRMQNASQTESTSWQQVAGIHGRPYVAWNNAQYVPGAPTIGYCTHSSPLFATWHRPYLALIEQVLARQVQDIAKLYPASQQATYQAAADNFRLPYWDWASQSDLPPITTATNVQIISPSGPTTVRNPLYSYRFPPLDRTQYPTTQDSGLSTYPETTRNPVSTVNSRLRANNLQRRTYQSITRSASFNAFSTSATPGTSIEAVHNLVHGDINVHMGSLGYSAFDPIFWLHHANVDRLTALYQCINPNNWLTSIPEPQGTFTIRQFQIVGGTTPLTPFTSTTSGISYTSDNSRYLAPFGYSYPEIIDWNQSAAELRSGCIAHLNRLYDPAGLFFKSRKHKRSIRRSIQNGNSLTEAIASSDAISDGEDKELRAWSVSIRVSKFDYPSPFVVRVFIGEPTSAAQNWFEDKKCIGSVFVNQPAGDASKYYTGSEGGRDVVVYDEIDIEHSLWQEGFDGKDVEATKVFLKKALLWRVQTPDGTEIPLTEIPSLKVAVAEEVVTLGRSITELPTYKNKLRHTDITKDKVGGFTGTAAG